MKKLLIITDMYPDISDPVNGVFVQQQAIALARYYQVMVIATSFSHPYQIARTNAHGIPVVYIYYPIPRFAHVLSTVSYRILCIPIISEEISDFAPDIIHVHDCRHYPELYCLSSLLHRFKRNNYLTLHNIRTHPREIANPITRIVYRVTLRIALQGWTKIFTVNRQLADLVSKYGTHCDTSVLGNAIVSSAVLAKALKSESSCRVLEFIAKVDETPNALKLISVGNLVPSKGFDLLLSALADVKSKGIEFFQVIIGAGESEKELNSLIHTLGLQDCVLLAGQIPNEEVRSLYKYFDTFVLPSWKETFGIVYLEAMEAGLLTVGVRGQGIDGVIRDKENGFLISPHDITAISDIIIDIARNMAQYAEIRENAKRTVAGGYLMDVLISKLKDEYDA